MRKENWHIICKDYLYDYIESELKENHSVKNMWIILNSITKVEWIKHSITWLINISQNEKKNWI